LLLGSPKELSRRILARPKGKGGCCCRCENLTKEGRRMSVRREKTDYPKRNCVINPGKKKRTIKRRRELNASRLLSKKKKKGGRHD